MEKLIFLWNVLAVALGIGFVVFIHELGHFALAKWNGVKVEKFSIGFGPSLLKFRRGETDYILAALPLGGYVKMLGESRDEGSVANVAEAASPEPPPQTNDPRAYFNKSVGARMTIISAGVVMNMIFGLACFSMVYSRGIDETPTRVGEVVPGTPAYEAGLRNGDEIVAIDGRRDLNFNNMRVKVMLSGAGQKLRFDVKRPGVADEFPVYLEPRRDPRRSTPTIGVLNEPSLELVPKRVFQAPPGLSGQPSGPEGGFQGWDRIVAVGPQGETPIPVRNSLEYKKVLSKYRDKPLTFVVERALANGEAPTETEPTGTPRRVSVEVPANRLQTLGLTMTAGPIASVQDLSPAKKAGLQAGDRILSVDGDADYDPLRLAEYVFDRAGRPIRLLVESTGGSRKTIEVVPDDSPIGPDLATMEAIPEPIPGLGLAIAVEPKIRAVASDSPAAKSGLKPGDVLGAVIVTKTPTDLEDEAPKNPNTRPEPIKHRYALEEKGVSWPAIHAALQAQSYDSIAVTLQGSDKPIALQTTSSVDRFDPHRGLAFRWLARKLPPQGFASSIRRGADDTIESVLGIYMMFRGLFQRRVGTENVGGLVRMSEMAYAQANAGLTPFLQFLGMLSINLAVLNFLPIPPLDGGQMVFLIGEKIRGRPLPDWLINVMFMVGITIVLGLMIFANGQDIVIKINEYFSK